MNLEEITKQYIEGRKLGHVIRSLNFGRVKLKETNTTWTELKIKPAEAGNTRVVDLVNRSWEAGEGHINITKQGKPVFKFTLENGLIKGLTNRVKFQGPRNVIGEFFAPVNTPESLIQEHTRIQMETTVPLDSKTTARADVSNTSKLYIGQFKCNGELSGKVIVELGNGNILEVSIETMKSEGYLPKTVLLTGRIDVNFQDKHSINVNK